MVNDSARLASNAPITESDNGENKYFAVPWSRNTGTNTMQMQRVDKNVGMATSLAPTTIDWCNGSRIATWRSMFSMTTVPLSTRIPIANANPPKVMVFSVCPVRLMNKTAVMMDNGIAARMITDRRTLPRNMMITSAVRPAAMQALRSTLFSAPFTNTDWSNKGLTVTSLGNTFLMSSRAARTPSITASVDTPPVLRIVISAPGVPLTDTEFV